LKYGIKININEVVGPYSCKIVKIKIKLPKEDVALVGVNGQKRLLAVRNYERIAADLAHQLNIL